MSKLISSLIVAVFLVGIFAGCGGELEETYMQVSLREANFASIKSPGFKFSFETPKFIVANGDLSLVREGNLIEFFTGYNIQGITEGLNGRRFSVGVTKKFTPMVHYLIDFIAVGQDTTYVDPPASEALPNIVKGFDDSPYEEIDLSEINYSTRTTADIVDLQFKVNGATVSYEEISYDGEAEMAYMLNLPNVRFIVDSPNEDAVTFLKALMNEHYYFDGGVKFGSRPSNATRNYRRANKIAGKVAVEYINYCGTTISTL